MSEPVSSPKPAPPALPAVLTSPWLVIVTGQLLWLAAAAAAFAAPGLTTWRPLTVAGLGVGLFGTGIFVWQRSAVRRGVRGAQSGLEDDAGERRRERPEEG